eukprot:SAG31_NODE_247_length_19134_cov_12.255050_10_plen_138_part_00
MQLCPCISARPLLVSELLALTQSAETALRDKEYTGSGHAFITFKTEDQALSFKGADRSADVSGVEAASWKVMMAPVPGEIYWENMGFSKSDRVAQKFKMGAVVLTVFVIFIMWALVAVLSIGQFFCCYPMLTQTLHH